MATGTHYTAPFRRKRVGKTDYRKRLKFLGSRKPRLVIRKKLKNMIAQIVAYEPNGDKIIASARSAELKKYGLTVLNGNIPIAYLTGLLLAKKAMEKKITEVTVDVGLQPLTAKSRIYALVKGAKEGGLTINADAKVLPDQARVSGKHIEAYAQKIKNDSAAYNKQFSAYLKEKVDPATISVMYDKVKQQLQSRS